MQGMLGAIFCLSSMLVLLGKGTFVQRLRNFSTILHSERPFFVVFWGVGCDLGSLGGWNDRVFRGRDKEPCEFWSLVRFLMSLWDSVSKIFCNYLIGNILLRWSPFIWLGCFGGIESNNKKIKHKFTWKPYCKEKNTILFSLIIF